MDVRGLPRQPGTSFLRAFDDEDTAVADNMRALFRDPSVPAPTKIAVREVIMTQPGLWSEDLRDLSGQELIERGIEQGIEQGRLLALRDLLARLLQRRLGSVPESLAAAIATCESAALLERAGERLVSEPDASLVAAIEAILAEPPSGGELTEPS